MKKITIELTGPESIDLATYSSASVKKINENFSLTEKQKYHEVRVKNLFTKIIEQINKQFTFFELEKIFDEMENDEKIYNLLKDN